MKQTIKQRLVDYINYRRIGQGKFEKSVGFSNGYINNIKGTFGADKLEKIFGIYPELNREWLLTGEGDMIKDESSKFADESEFVSYLKSQIEELKQDNEDLKLKNERLAEQNGYYKGLLDNNGISYKQTAS